MRYRWRVCNLPPHVMCCCVQEGCLPLHLAAESNKSEAVIKALLDAYPDAIKEKAHHRYLPLHLAAASSESEAVIKVLLNAYPGAAKERNTRYKEAVNWSLPKDLARTDAIKASRRPVSNSRKPMPVVRKGV